MNKQHLPPAIIYNLFPRLVGPMSGWKSHFERAKYMGFNWIYINPLSYPGFSGSLYSIKDYYRINPLFLDNSGRSEEEQVRAMIQDAHELGLKIMFDLVINHTAIDSVLIVNDKWYKKDEHGKIKNPQVWEGDKLITTWGDLAEIDNEKSPDKDNLWRYWLDLTSYYIDFGVDGFRCDAAYQVTTELWEYLISNIKQRKTDTVFFAETLGCEIEDVIELAKAGFDYSFNSSKWWDFEESWCLKQYKENAEVSPSVSFAESHDTPRLTEEFKGEEAAVKLRYLFSAIFSSGVMMPVGLEYGFKKRLNVVHTLPQDWETQQFDLTEFIRKANQLKLQYKIFSEDNAIEIIETVNKKVFVMLKISHDKKEKALIIINKNLQGTEHLSIDLVEIMNCSSFKIKCLSIENPLTEMPDVLEYNLQPGQMMILYC
ncbi:MAG: alpha-amylase family glycosyl hydrolase [Candidatus Margulisbacteria bacterium]|nr:alpha-amylase family glycosyl hydrolase [Candidatus Margulisiibacteriota bacterium]